jgi:Tol biopolymer transport system component
MQIKHLALSPNGKWLAVTLTKGSSQSLWALDLATGEPKLLVDDPGGRHPFWSPDSRFIGFFASDKLKFPNDKLKKVALTGGLPVTLCDFPFGDGGSWNREDVIILSGWGELGLSRVPATGGPVTPILQPNSKGPEVRLRFPSFLPDGHHFIGTVINEDKETSGIYLGSLDGDAPQRLLDDISNARYAADGSGVGHLLFGREGALMAQPFDAKKLRLDGQPFPVAGEVSTIPTTNLYRFSASETGVLVFDPVTNRMIQRAYMVDRGGKTIHSLKPLDDVNRTRLAPDGQHVLLSRYNLQSGGSDLWLRDVTSGTDVRLTFNPSNNFVVAWSPDARRIVMASKRGEHYQLYEKAVSQPGQEALLFQSNVSKYPTDWSPDGRYIIYFQVMPQTKNDLWALPLFGDRKPFPF